MPLIGLQKSLWLVAIAASCWTVWLSRNGKMFERLVTTLDALLFHSKMRALMWARVVHNECIFLESDWWSWPVKCCMGGRSMRTRGCAAGGLEMAVLMAIKEVAEMVIELIWKEQAPFIEYDSITISDWLKYSHLRPWSFTNLFANIEGSLR
ncbi:hypothetical protein Gotur_015949 [Gossypium turneri]